MCHLLEVEVTQQPTKQLAVYHDAVVHYQNSPALSGGKSNLDTAVRGEDLLTAKMQKSASILRVWSLKVGCFCPTFFLNIILNLSLECTVS